MATPSIFIVPVDPAATTDSSAVEGVQPSKLWATLPSAKGPKPAKAGTTHLLFNTPPEKHTALASPGPAFSKPYTAVNARHEAVRTAVGSAVQAVKGLGEGVHGQTVGVDLTLAGEAHAQAASEAAHLALYGFDLKTEPPSPFDPSLKTPAKDKLSFVPLSKSSTAQLKKAWEDGKAYAEAQNLARTLMELPANLLTPTLFTERIRKEAAGLSGVEVIIRDRGVYTSTHLRPGLKDGRAEN